MPSDAPTKIFFAYPTAPEAVRETVANAAAALDKQADVSVRTWEQVAVDGRVVVAQITAAIDTADVVCCEVGALNSNVLFELGFAIGQGKAVRILLDTTDDDAVRSWKEFGLLSLIGYLGYANSLDIRSRLLGGLTKEALTPLWDEIEGAATFSPQSSRTLFYFPANHVTEASRVLTRRIDNSARRGWDVINADPSEIGAAPISWFLQGIYRSSGAIVHFMAPRRTNARVHNARGALCAGVALGLGRPLVMLAEEDYLAPFDYAHLLRTYTSSKQVGTDIENWLAGLPSTATEVPATSFTSSVQRRLSLRTELQGLNFFEYVAEQEITTLDEYFVRTQQFQDVLTSPLILFVGRKGVGKTANMLEAADSLAADKRNLVCTIKPADYELRGLLDVLRRYRGRESRTYLVENMWKYLLYTEIAKSAVERAEAMPAGIDEHTKMGALRAYLDNPSLGLREDFSVRLETIIDALLKRTDPSIERLADARDNIGSALGGVMMRDLRRHLESALTEFDRVAVLVDNLDKAWARSADLDDLSTVLLGLLTSIGRISNEFRIEATKGNPTAFTLSLFLRSDIYNHLVRVAREPDKIKTAAIEWDDPNLLLRVIEERYLYSSGRDSSHDLWSKFFCASVEELPTKEYLLTRSLPRPRDLLYIVNAAVSNAVNAGHALVEEKDIVRAAKSYSRFAFEAVLVANSITTAKLEELLYEFGGGPASVDERDILGAMQRAGVDEALRDDVVAHLLSLEFLGRETAPDRYSYGDEGPQARLTEVLARKVAEGRGAPARYRVHPAFCPYLELVES